MSNEELKLQIGRNIVQLRKDAGLTQAELAEKLNYSDKAISKWERGESMPDLITVVQLAEVFRTDVNHLISCSVPEEPVSAGADIPAAPATIPESPVKRIRRKASKNVIQILCSILVWFVALFVYIFLDSFHVEHSNTVFYFAIPANAIVLLSLRSAWHNFSWNKMLISVIMWGSLLCIHMILLLACQVNVWRIYLLGILGQFAIFYLFRLFAQDVKEDS